VEGWPVIEMMHVRPIFDYTQRLLLCQNAQGLEMLFSFQHKEKQKIANPALSSHCIESISQLICSVTYDDNAPSIRKIKHTSSLRYYRVFTYQEILVLNLLNV
jgi:hypothetical protein